MEEIVFGATRLDKNRTQGIIILIIVQDKLSSLSLKIEKCQRDSYLGERRVSSHEWKNGELI